MIPSSTYAVIAHFALGKIPIKELHEEMPPGELIKREGSFLLYRIDHDSYIYLKDYGSIVFFNVRDGLVSRLLQEWVSRYDLEITDYVDTIDVIIRGEDDGTPAGFDEVVVEDIDGEVSHIVCLHLAQSVALFYYQSLADDLLETTRLHTNELETKGTMSLRRKKLMKYIGSTLNIKNKISENLYIFDIPLIAWESQKIAKIDAQLNEELEIKMRYNAIREQVNIIQENLALFKDLSLHKHSSLLEWIIIWLILIEVVQVIIEWLV